MSDAAREGVSSSRSAAALRTAGWLLLVHGLLDVVEIAVVPAGTQAVRGNLTLILDVVIGVSMIRGSDRLVTLALARVAFALVLFVAVPLTRGETLLPLYQATWCAALLLVLVGAAGRTRIAAGCAVFAGYVALQAIGLYGATSGRVPLWRVAYALRDELTAAPTEVVGAASAYRLQVPATGWYVRRPEVARADNPYADVWLVRPDVDAHVLVFDEAAPGVAIEELVDVAVANVREGATELRELERRPLPAYPQDGRIVSLTLTAGGALAYRVGAVVGGGRGYQIVGFTAAGAGAEAAAELVGIVESFRLPGA